MTRSFPGRFLLVLALIAFVAGIAGCAATTTPAPQARPTATLSRSPVARATAGPTTAPIPGGLAIATPSAGDRMPIVKIDDLPPEAHDTIRLIAAGGPFPYRQDGVVFENRERLLPAKATGYYREYTVKTLGSPDRGARRLIRGGQNELYYTDDHYDSFRRVIP
jgi:ribonuclease T1